MAEEYKLKGEKHSENHSKEENYPFWNCILLIEIEVTKVDWMISTFLTKIGHCSACVINGCAFIWCVLVPRLKCQNINLKAFFDDSNFMLPRKRFQNNQFKLWMRQAKQKKTRRKEINSCFCIKSRAAVAWRSQFQYNFESYYRCANGHLKLNWNHHYARTVRAHKYSQLTELHEIV